MDAKEIFANFNMFAFHINFNYMMSSIAIEIE